LVDIVKSLLWVFLYVIFRDRSHAGGEVASMVGHLKGEDCIVLAIPRGGVVVGYEVAKALSCPMDVIVPRKIGAPGQPELALGAVSEDGSVYIDESLARLVGADQRYIDEMVDAELAEIRRRVGVYRGGRPVADVAGKVVILVDDGLATGATVLAAIRHLRRLGPRKIIVAVPVAAKETVEKVGKEADEVLCRYMPRDFYAIGQFYQSFEQLSDDEVLELLSNVRWR
jgi:putative phosphoribosyl transferase